MFKVRQNWDRVWNLEQFSIPGDLVIFPGQTVKVWDCPNKVGMDNQVNCSLIFCADCDKQATEACDSYTNSLSRGCDVNQQSFGHLCVCDLQFWVLLLYFLQRKLDDSGDESADNDEMDADEKQPSGDVCELEDSRGRNLREKRSTFICEEEKTVLQMCLEYFHKILKR